MATYLFLSGLGAEHFIKHEFLPIGGLNILIRWKFQTTFDPVIVPTPGEHTNITLDFL